MPATDKTTDAFLDALEQALEHDSDPAWLEAHSPLAAPYFLGAQAGDAPGQALRRILREVASALEPSLQRLLDASFFKRDWSRNINGVAMALNQSRAAYYRHRAAALADLAEALSRRVMPSVRLESVPVPSASLIGRATQLTDVLEALRAGRMAAIIGPSGAGKSVLGGAVCVEFGLPRTFWYTVRPGLNDQFISFVFSLAYFLRGHGADSAWRQLVADAERLDAGRALSLIRHDLVEASKQPVLLCVDEAHALEPERDAHAQILNLIQDVRAHAPVLLIGQQLVLKPQSVVALAPLDLEQSAALLGQGGIDGLTPDVVDHLHRITRGNPALLRLVAAFGRDSATVAASLMSDPTQSSEAVLDRLWTRLPADERAVLAALSAFADDAPDDLFRSANVQLDALLRAGLVLRSGPGASGGLNLPAAIRAYVLRQLSPDERQQLHAAAAEALAARGRHTQSAHQWVSARQPARGIWQWYEHRERETALGMSASVMAAFADVAYADLPDDDTRRALALIRTEALRQQGKPEQAAVALDGASWPAAHPATPYAHRLRGWLHEMDGRLDAATSEFEAGLRSFVERGRREGAYLSMARGYVHFRARNMPQAAQFALQARIEAEDFQAMVALDAGDYAGARAHATAALHLIGGLHQPSSALEAKLEERLGRLAWQTGQPDEAARHLERAKSLLHSSGDRVGVAYVNLSLSAAHIVARNYEVALASCAEGLALAESLRHGYLLAFLSVNAGEAAYYLNRIDDAEWHALRALRQEEDAAQPYAFTVIGLVARARRDWTSAEADLFMAIDSGRQIADPYVEACAHRWLGQVYDDQHLRDKALACYAAAQALFESMGLQNEVLATQALSA